MLLDHKKYYKSKKVMCNFFFFGVLAAFICDNVKRHFILRLQGPVVPAHDAVWMFLFVS